MSARVDSIFEAAMKLSDDERAELSDLLFYTLPPDRQDEVDKAWAEEVGRRMDAYRRGEVEALELDETLALLRQGKRP